MKKILLIIFLFFCCTSVYAKERQFVGSEFLNGISYLKYDGSNYYYRNAQVIRDVKTNEVAYCVEPFTLLVDYSSYTSNSSYSSKYNISKAAWDKAKLIAYYGYGYKGHTNKKWISITQLTIWRTLHPEYKFEWIDNVDSRQVIKPYNTEIKELNNLVNNHSTLPKIEKSYELSINDTLEVQDTNKVLSNYKIKSSDFDAQIKDNTLVINAPGVDKEGKIVLERAANIYSDTILFYYDSASQNVMERGNITPIKYEINVKVDSGKVKVKKTDSETKKCIPQGNAVLDGAVFNLYDEDMQIIGTSEVKDCYIEFDNLKFGKYFIKEEKAGIGYNINTNMYEFEINENNLNPEIIIENDVIKSKIRLTKYFGTKEEFKKNKMKYEKEISFEIFNEKNEKVFDGITDKNGSLEVELPYGKYVIRQKNSTKGYKKVPDYEFVIDEDSNYSIDIPFYDFKIEVPNAGMNIFQYIKFLLGVLNV